MPGGAVSVIWSRNGFLFKWAILFFITCDLCWEGVYLGVMVFLFLVRFRDFCASFDDSVSVCFLKLFWAPINKAFRNSGEMGRVCVIL